MTNRLRALSTALLLLVMTACTQEGIDAGEDGGVAFIAMTGMLIITCVLLWFFLGRND